eukprot:1139797-Pelagomonas_calceolata.AAC.4
MAMDQTYGVHYWHKIVTYWCKDGEVAQGSSWHSSVRVQVLRWDGAVYEGVIGNNNQSRYRNVASRPRVFLLNKTECL